jgi:hypothetical protein
LCFDNAFGGCYALPGVDITYDRGSNRYLFTFSAAIGGYINEYVYSAPAAWYGALAGHPTTLLSAFTYTGITSTGSTFGPGFFRQTDGYLTKHYGYVHTMTSDRDPHHGDTELIRAAWFQ